MDESIRTLNAFYSVYLDCDLNSIPPGEPYIVASRRRGRREMNYGSVFLMWLLLTGDRCVASVQESLMRPIAAALRGKHGDEYDDQAEREDLTEIVRDAFGSREEIAAVSGPIYYCTTHTLCLCHLYPCRRVNAQDVRFLQEVRLYNTSLDRSIAEGTCFAACSEGQPVSLSGTHVNGHMDEAVGDLNVPGTLEAYRRQGYAKTAVSHTTKAILALGRVPLYSTSDRNLASTSTARSVGYVPYGWQLRIQLTLPEDGSGPTLRSRLHVQTAIPGTDRWRPDL